MKRTISILGILIGLGIWSGGASWAMDQFGRLPNVLESRTAFLAEEQNPAQPGPIEKQSAEAEKPASNESPASPSAEEPKPAPSQAQPAEPSKPNQAEQSQPLPAEQPKSAPAEQPKPPAEPSQPPPAEQAKPAPAEEPKPSSPEQPEPKAPEQPKAEEGKTPRPKMIQEQQQIPVPGGLEKLLPGQPASKEPPKPKLPPLPPWQPPQPEQVRDKVFSWLSGRQILPEHQGRIEQLWAGDLSQLSGLDLLVRVVLTYALADKEAAELVKLCSAPRIHLILPSFPWLTDPKTDPYMAANLRLLYGRWLVHEMLYEEALEMLGDLNPDDVADPASLLFYQSVANYFLLHQEEGLRRLEALLREPDRCPRRYVALASLMQEDLKQLREETLDHIARRMKDVERRLGLYRAGPKVRSIQDKIVEDLDKIIKRLEEQQQKGGGGGSSGGSGGRTIRSSAPASDSRIIGGKGPGEVDKRDVGSGSGWGNLPPRERENILQEIGKEFPAQYRQKIEQYFRKLAESTETKKSP